MISSDSPVYFAASAKRRLHASSCVSLKDGKSKWKMRGYGNGQVLLLAEQGLLLVLSEKGEVALVQAIPEQQKELARFPAIEGKTWNHPVVAHGKLYVRNGEEAACYQLPEEAAADPQ
jgi:outer membrane protein assembly factor BamB